MQFSWDEINEAELEAHGIDRATAEAVFSPKIVESARIRVSPTGFSLKGLWMGSCTAFLFQMCSQMASVSPRPSASLGKGGEHDQAQDRSERNDLGGIL
jgi:hypothetical protein